MVRYQVVSQFRKVSEAVEFVSHVQGWDSIQQITRKGKTVVWITRGDQESIRQHVLDLQETVHYFGSPELGRKTRTNSSWITGCTEMPEDTPEEAPEMTTPAVTPSKVVATAVTAGMKVRLANRQGTELSAEYVEVGENHAEGNAMRKITRTDGTVYATVGNRAKFEIEPAVKPATARKPSKKATTAAAPAGPKMSKFARKHLDHLAATEGQSTTRQEWGADPMIVKSLEGKGLIKVTRDENDKKRGADLIELTPEGSLAVGDTTPTAPAEDADQTEAE